MERAAFAGQWWRPFLVAGPPTKWSSCLHCLFDIIGFCRVLHFPTNCFTIQILVHYSYPRPKFLIIMTITTLTKMWTTMLDIRRNIGGALVAAQEIECGAPPTHLPTRVRKTLVADVGEIRVWFASKILTPCRMHWNAFLIAQIKAKCHSFPNMCGML